MITLQFVPALILACLNLINAAEQTPAMREHVNFNSEWRFELGNHPRAEAADFDDTKWDAVNLPHSFSIPYFLSPKFYVGYGWYRKHFVVPASWSDKRLFLEFEGAFQDAEIFVNGRLVGRHLGGYTGFSFDVTSSVKPGDNVAAVKLNNNWNPELAPRAGEHVFSGGIYRDVWLEATDPLHVAWCGTFVTTSRVSADSGTVNVKTEIRNDTAASRQCLLKTEILDPDGKLVANMSSSQAIAAGATVTFDQTSDPIANPRLWHPDHPFLYLAVSTVYDGQRAVDRFETIFGFRWFEWTADKGFFLNGEHYYIKGANVHQDHAGWGDAVVNAGFERDVRMVKEAGFDFIRGSHYPHDPAFADACDKLGVLFWSENCFWGSGPFKSPWGGSAYPPEPEHQAAFEENVKQSLREMIRVNRNHPSIVAWSMGNEAYFSEKKTLPKVRELLKQLVALSRELDPTRPAAIGGTQRGSIDKIGDIAGYNGDGARLFINPGIPSLVSEYGSTIADRPGKYEPGWGNLPQGPGDKSQPYFWRYPWRSGEVIWCAFDHGSLGGHFGCMGMIDYFRLPKRQWYWYRNEYKSVPPPEWPSSGAPAGLRLTADKTTLDSVDGTDDAQIVVSVTDIAGKALSNSPPVTLTIESGPGEFPTGTSITFDPQSDIVIRDGRAAIEFRSYHSGKTVIRAASPGLKDATITINSLGEPKYIAGKTPSVKPRPYARFGEKSATAATARAVSTFGLDNPTRCSSEATEHTARLGNDGNAATYWQANEGDSNAWWQVDLERLVEVTQTKLVFPSDGNYRYKIEISEDGLRWTLAIDQTRNVNTGKTRTDAAAKAVSGRFVRVTFSELPEKLTASLAEVEVSGNQATK